MSFFNIPNGILSWRLHQKDEKTLPPEQRAEIEAEVHDLAHRAGIKKKLEISENKELREAHAMGNSLLPGRAGIAMPLGGGLLFRESREFILAREISHIKRNDLLTMPLTAGCIGGVTAAALSVLFPGVQLIVSGLVGSLVSHVAYAAISQRNERSADERAFSLCSPEGKAKASEWLKTIQRTQLNARNKPTLSGISRFLTRLVIDAKGEARLDFFHPKLKTRIEYLHQLQSPNSRDGAPVQAN